MSSGSIEDSGIMPGLAVLEQPVVVGEGLDGDRVDPAVGHLVAGPVRALHYSCCDRRLAGWPRRNPDRTIRRPPTAAGAKIALRDQISTARNRLRVAELGERAAVSPSVVTAHPGRTPGGHRRGVRLGRVRARHRRAAGGAGRPPGSGCILPVVLPDMDLDWGACARLGPRWCRRATGCSSRSDRLGVDAIAHRRRGAGARAGGLDDRRSARPGRRLLRPGAGPGAGRHPRLRAALRRRGRRRRTGRDARPPVTAAATPAAAGSRRG